MEFDYEVLPETLIHTIVTTEVGDIGYIINCNGHRIPWFRYDHDQSSPSIYIADSPVFPNTEDLYTEQEQISKSSCFILDTKSNEWIEIPHDEVLSTLSGLAHGTPVIWGNTVDPSASENFVMVQMSDGWWVTNSCGPRPLWDVADDILWGDELDDWDDAENYLRRRYGEYFEPREEVVVLRNPNDLDRLTS